MCGPLKTWKMTVYINSFCIAAIGIVIMIVALVIESKDFAKAIEADNMAKAFGIVFGAFLIIIGLIEWLSVKCERKCLILILFLHNLLLPIHKSNS
jgi:hypothetical protein